MLNRWHITDLETTQYVLSQEVKQNTSYLIKSFIRMYRYNGSLGQKWLCFLICRGSGQSSVKPLWIQIKSIKTDLKVSNYDGWLGCDLFNSHIFPFERFTCERCIFALEHWGKGVLRTLRLRLKSLLSTISLFGELYYTLYSWLKISHNAPWNIVHNGWSLTENYVPSWIDWSGKKCVQK